MHRLGIELRSPGPISDTLSHRHKSRLVQKGRTSVGNQSKKEGKDQESIQSSTSPDPGYQWESENVTIRHHKLPLPHIPNPFLDSASNLSLDSTNLYIKPMCSEPIRWVIHMGHQM